MNGKLKVILASGSKNRKNILKALGVDFTAVPSKIDERNVSGKSIEEKIKNIARRKAQHAAKAKHSLIIAADTFSTIGKTELHKPANRSEARTLLKKISGKKIRVRTGICIINTERNYEICELRSATIYCKNLSDKQIEEYVKKKPVTEWAAAYNPEDPISSKIFVPVKPYRYGMENFSLPLDILSRELKKAGIEVDVSRRLRTKS